MTESQVYNVLMLICGAAFGAGVIRDKKYRAKRGGFVDSFHIITAMIRRERKERQRKNYYPYFG